MPRAKKWFLEETESETDTKKLVLKNDDGLMKKPYATQALGAIKQVHK